MKSSSMTDDTVGRTHPSLLNRLRASACDEQAWGEFVHRYGARILGWCRKWHLQEADAHDVTQNVLLKLAARMRSFTYDPSRSFRAYLKTLTNYALSDFLASRAGPVAVGGSVALERIQTAEARTDLAQELSTAFDQEILERAMELVRERVEAHTWRAFHLTAVEGRSGAEAAQELNMKVATVFKARSKVQQMLRAEIQDLDGND
jgi:RNA polymerase sigma-70 factor (ECF subfamily)